MGGLIVYFLFQAFFSAQRFQSKAISITLCIILTVCSSAYLKGNIGVLEIALLVTGSSALHSTYRNE